MQAQTLAQRTAFKRWDKAFEPYEKDFKWEPVEHTSADGYILISFVITAKADSVAPNPPVLIQHGNGWDAASWLASLDDGRGPLPLNLVKRGYQVWMMNQRGTEYSRKHTSYQANSKEFWDFDVFTLWNDIESNIKTMKAFSGYDVFWYVGYSGATMQMLYGLATKSP